METQGDEISLNTKMFRKQYYVEQAGEWPKTGKHILAQYDNDSVIVYQAYKPSIGHFAVNNQYFGEDFSLARMSWIKPNFLWMMYRSGWGNKPGQEVILSIRLKRSFFDSILELAVASNFRQCSTYETQGQWKEALALSNVRLQWDPDHSPSGEKEERKAIQLGLRNEQLVEYARDAIIQITDISIFVNEQKKYATRDYAKLVIPEEKIYIPSSEKARRNINLD